MRKITWDGAFCRSDIGYRAIARETVRSRCIDRRGPRRATASTVEQAAELAVLSEREIRLRRSQTVAVVKPTVIVRHEQRGAGAGGLAARMSAAESPIHHGRVRGAFERLQRSQHRLGMRLVVRRVSPPPRTKSNRC